MRRADASPEELKSRRLLPNTEQHVWSEQAGEQTEDTLKKKKKKKWKWKRKKADARGFPGHASVFGAL